jgi:hypothetical protein
LRNFPELVTLPQEIENWQSLKKIYFRDCFKNRKAMSFEDELFHEDKAIELPATLSGLKNLEVFDISFCPVSNLNPLASLDKLREVEVCQAQLTDISALKNLKSLEKLDLSDSYEIDSLECLSELTELTFLDISETKIKSLEPLKNLTKLEYLNVKNSSLDKSKAKLKDALQPLYCLENLKELKAKHLSKEEWVNRDWGQDQKERLTPEKILDVLKNETSSLPELEGALNSIGDMESLFGVSRYDVDDGTLEIDILDRVVTSRIQELSEETLRKLLSVSFADTGMGDSYKVTVLVIEEIIHRKDITGQNQVVKAFMGCTEYYDAGHRYYCSTVQDQLIDTLFPAFELEPLASLMLQVGDGLLHPEWGDDMASLFPALFAQMGGSEYEEKVIDRLRSFILENCENEETLGVLDGILKEELSSDNRAAVEEIKNTAAIIVAGLAGESLDAFQALLQGVGKTIPLEIFVHFDLSEGLGKIDFNELSSELVGDLFNQIISLKNGQAPSQIVKLFFTVDRSGLDERIASLATGEEKKKETLMSFLKKAVSREEESYIDKEAYEAFAQKNLNFLLGKSEEDVQKELAEKEAARQKQEAEEKEKALLKEAFSECLGSGDNDAFINQSLQVIEGSKTPVDYAFLLANYTTKLLINSLQRGNFAAAKGVVVHFAEKLLPLAGESRKQDDVASNALVLAILSKDKEVESLVFTKLLPPDLIAEEVSNEVLAFNLACYYAINSNKERLLPIVKRSLILGKSPDQYKSDTDFQAFWEDEDFLAVLES